MPLVVVLAAGTIAVLRGAAGPPGAATSADGADEPAADAPEPEGRSTGGGDLDTTTTGPA